VFVPGKSPVKVYPKILDMFFLGELHIVVSINLLILLVAGCKNQISLVTNLNPVYSLS
jgi:hypothetical protein